MKRLPSELFSTPPSPRTDSVTRMPFTDGGQTIPVGWNWTNSMFSKRRPGPHGKRVSVAGVLPRVGRDLERLADAAGGQDHGRRAEQHEPSGLAPVPECAGDAPELVAQQLGDRALGEDLQLAVRAAELSLVVLLQRDDLLLQGADEFEAGAVADVGQARVLVAAEVALADLAVLGAVEQRAVGLELPDPGGRLLGVQFGHSPVVEELAAAHRVAEVNLPVVVAVDVAHAGRDAAFGHDGVRLAEQRLADDRGAHAGLAGGDGRAQPGATRADDDDVVVVLLDFSHCALS